ncbi:peptidylprolyl isomerase [uncultured Paludibaculum sp.]|uniref:peptidylprolyl isomerase n=1 Tax=uncultured Paludibaculum sp. TaxID=1765020 RepID=UPI002AAAD8FF|nr:peptidylprolyl isomerase [uncultured Paludibaculum sp.]
MRVLLIVMLGGAVWAQAPAAAPAKQAPAKASPAQSPAAKPATTPAKPAAAPAKPAAAPAAAKPAGNDPVVFTAGPRKMTKSEFDDIMSNLPANLKNQLGGNTPEARRKLAEQLGEIYTYAAEARRLKIDEKPAVKLQLQLQTEGILASNLYQHLLELNKPTEAAEKEWYEGHKNDFASAKARHILIRFKGSRVPLKKDQKDLTEEEALSKTNELREKISKGEDFATLAKAESDDTGSGAQGGDLGTFAKGKMVPQFDQAVFSLPIGELSQPVKSQFGYHLIQVQERGAKPFEEVKTEIERRMESEHAQKAMETVKAAGKPVLDETYFGAPTAPATVKQ